MKNIHELSDMQIRSDSLRVPAILTEQSEEMSLGGYSAIRKTWETSFCQCRGVKRFKPGSECTGHEGFHHSLSIGHSRSHMKSGLQGLPVCNGQRKPSIWLGSLRKIDLMAEVQQNFSP